MSFFPAKRSWLMLGLTLFLLFSATPARAATFVINSMSDAVDDNPGDGVCWTRFGTCTLRAAIQEANAWPGPDTIQVPAGSYVLAIPAVNANDADSGDFDITSPLTIIGDGAAVTILDGGQPPAGSPPERTALDRLFEIHPAAGAVTLSGLTIRKGWAEKEGGALYNRSGGVVRLVEVNLLNSFAGNYGGGIYNDGIEGGSLIIDRSTIADNTTNGLGGGIYSAMGAVSVIGTPDANSTISGNTARNGGGIYNAGVVTPAGRRSQVELSYVTVSANTATNQGGGLYNELEGDLSLTDVTVSANMAAADGGGVISLSKTSLIVNKGTFSGNTATGSGGGMFVHTEQSVTIDGALFSENSSGEGDQEHGGGGLSLDGSGSATIIRSTFSGNTATGEGGGVAIHSSGPVAISDSIVRDNASQTRGGGLLNSGMIVILTRMTISGNTAVEAGGGIDNQSSGEFTILDTSITSNSAENGGGFVNAADSTLRISGVTFWNNRARATGGGFLHLSDGAADIENTTLSGNLAGQIGGGLHIDANAGLNVVNTTITRNWAPGGAGVGGPDEESFILPSPPVIFRNTIVAGNLLGDDCSGPVNSEGGNLDGGITCFFDGPGDRSNVNLPLAPLADNGGPTLTHGLLASSLAVDGGVDPCPATDQRGLTRPQNSGCDSGAYEFEGIPEPPQAPPDMTPPDTLITSGPFDPSSSPIATFTFSSEPGAIFECALDGFAFAACISPVEYTDLGPGGHIFEIRAIDSEGNIDASPEAYPWTIDTSSTSCGPAATFLAEADTWIEQNSPSSNKGTDSILKIRSKGPNDNARALVRFALPDQPDDCIVQSATLRLYAPSAIPGRLLQAFRLTAGWTEETVTWSSQPATTGPAATTNAGPGYLEWGVMSQVQAMYDADANHGFLIRDAVEGSSGIEQQFYSREKSENLPELVLRFAPEISPGIPPETTIISGPTSATTARNGTFTFSATKPGATFECALDGAEFEDCPSPVTYTGLAFAEHTLEVRAIDLDGNTDPTPASYTWTVSTQPDCGAPLTLLANADTWIEQNSPSTNRGADTILRVKSQGPSDNARVLIRFPLPDRPAGCAVQSATLRLQAVSTASSRPLEALQVVIPWLESLVTWSVQPSTAGPVAVAGSTTGNYEWDVTVQTQAMYDANAGHGFLIRDAAEGSGSSEQQFHSREQNDDSSPQLIVQFVAITPPDTTPPQTTLDSMPPVVTMDTSATFTFSADETGSTFECHLDEAAFAACDSPHEVTDLAEGVHTFQVRAVDLAGNPDLTPASYTWTVETPTPTPTATIVPTDTPLPPTATPTNTSVPPTATNTPVPPTATPTDTPVPPTATNTPPSDTTAPDTLFALLGMPPDPSPSSSATFNFTATEPGSTFECRLDGAVFATCVPPYEVTGLSEGVHTFEVWATDLAGNTDPTPASYTWTVALPTPTPTATAEPTETPTVTPTNTPPPDTTAPDTLFTLLGTPPDPSPSSSATFDFIATEAGSTFECRLDGAAFAVCAPPYEVMGLSEGVHTFEVRAIDLAGNTDPTPVSHTWTVAPPTPTPTVTPVPTTPPTATTAPTDTPVPPSATPTDTPIPPTATNTPVLPTATNTAIPPSATPTNTPVPPTATNTAVPPSATPTDTPVPPTVTNTPVPPTATSTDTPAPPTATPTNTPVPPTCTTTTVTLTANADTWIDQNSSSNNFGSDAILKVRSQAPGDNFRALVRFSMPASVPEGCRIESATLRLYAASATQDRTIEARQIASDWLENSVTWSNQPRTTDGAATTSSGSGYREWNVTAQAQAMFDTGANHGFMILDADESSSGSEQQFHGREKGENPPQLVLQFAPAGG